MRESPSPARVFTSETPRLEGMERFISPKNFPSFFKRYLSQLLTSPSASENGISQEAPKLILDPQLTPRLVVPLAMGPNAVGEPGAQVPGAVSWLHPGDKVLYISQQSIQEAVTQSTA